MYFIGFQSNQGGALEYSIHHPLVSAKFYLLAIGDVTGLSETGAGGTTVGIELFGLVILTLSVWAIVAYCRGRLAPRGGPLAVAILCFGLLFAAFVTGSRAVVGLSAASQPRYRTFDLLILVGLYLLGMEEFVRWRAARRLGTTTPAEDVDTGSARVRQPQATVFVGLVVLVACMQLALGIPQGVTGARGYHDEQLSAARVLADIAHYPDSFVEAKLGIFQSAAYLRRMSAVAQLHHLSMFGTGAVARYKAEGPIALPTTSIRFVVPHSNSTIKGKQLLGFALSDVFTVTDARFEVTGGSLNHEVISSATPFQYGWIGAWNTTTVPDGHYELQAVASDSGGHTLRTAEVSVTVHNG